MWKFLGRCSAATGNLSAGVGIGDAATGARVVASLVSGIACVQDGAPAAIGGPGSAGAAATGAGAGAAALGAGAGAGVAGVEGAGADVAAGGCWALAGTAAAASPATSAASNTLRECDCSFMASPPLGGCGGAG